MSKNDSKLEQDLLTYIRNNTNGAVNKLTTQTLLFHEGIFDSMAFVLLIDYIEETFGIKPSDEDLVEKNFESIEAITRYIQRKKETTS
ncbi:MAG: acyl carrier protein [Bacteroidales bacterium]|nr:acyl carrier protein [Bacteroidales bacterium]